MLLFQGKFAKKTLDRMGKAIISFSCRELLMSTPKISKNPETE